MLPLHVACKYHHNYNVINMILERNRNSTEVTYNETQLPLHDAVGRYPLLHLDVIWLLILKSLETVSARMLYGQNVLHIALNIKKVPKQLINLLLDTVHADLLLQTVDYGMTPLHFACLHQNNAIILAVLRKNENAARMPDNQRNLPLHFTCGQYPVMKTPILHTLLNTYPESVSIMTENNSLPIHLYIEATPKGREELLSFHVSFIKPELS